jgi:hypothetical protein
LLLRSRKPSLLLLIDNIVCFIFLDVLTLDSESRHERYKAPACPRPPYSCPCYPQNWWESWKRMLFLLWWPVAWSSLSLSPNADADSDACLDRARANLRTRAHLHICTSAPYENQRKQSESEPKPSNFPHFPITPSSARAQLFFSHIPHLCSSTPDLAFNLKYCAFTAQLVHSPRFPPGRRST